MSWGTSNRDGGKTSESGHLRALSKAVLGEVLNGLNVTQRAAGANMSVDIAVGDAIIMRSDGTYGHPVFNDATENKTVTTADGSNPRRDIVVVYVDYGQARSTAVSNNTNGVIKTMIVAGTPAGSPTDPSNATIQSAVGSGNPFIKLARVRVPAGQTSISNTLIDDMRIIASGLSNGGWEMLSSTEAASVSFSSYNSARRIGVITVPSDATLKYTPGNKFRFYQATGGWKYGFIMGVTSTTITVFVAAGVTINNEAILLPAFSYAYSPLGYNAPHLVKEAYRSNTTDAERWIYESSGWVATTGSGTGASQATVPLPITYAAIPIILVSAAGDQVSGSAALGNGGNSVHGLVTAKHFQDTVSNFIGYTWTNAGSWSAGNLQYITWHGRGPVN